MGRTTWTDLDGMKKGEWTAEEDRKLAVYINEYGLGDWRSLPKRAGLQRCGKSCRLRWLNYLRPGIKRGKFTPQEEEEIIKFHSLLGNRWAAIAKQMPNRTDNDIKNHWNSCLKKRLVRNGIDPITHEPMVPMVPMVMTVEVTASSTTSSPTPTPTHSCSSSWTSSSSTGSARLLNKLATGISSRKDGLDRIKTMILSELARQDSVSEPRQASVKEDEEVIGCFMDIEKMISTTTSFDQSTSFVGFDPNLDYSLSIDPYGLYQSDFFDDETEQLDNMFLL
ncbi:hypothetical protein AALP_AA2G185100 [Arabis alpina]|uniref:Uncharacterized protein n=1 Tax=Arabis alpina TaxID=50452 RepID=A0A087HID5_ARAAL|nr:hypothetical protein AALP_AA2G185100 [Arabis alpina]